MKLELTARNLHPEAVSEILAIVEGGRVDKFITEEEPVQAFALAAVATPPDEEDE